MPRRYSSPRLALPSRNTLRVAILAALSAAPVLQAATVLPGGALDASEFLVNSFTTGNQTLPRIARDAAGDFVVVWESPNQAASGSQYDVYGQRYNAAGQAQGSAFLVNTYTSGFQGDAHVAMDAAGDFVVVWESIDQAATNSGSDVYARQYNAAGTPLQASEFLVTTVTSNSQNDASVAMDAAGDFVVAWESKDQASSNSYYDIYARQFNTAGSASSSEFLVNTLTSNWQAFPQVAMDAAGDFVVTWMSYEQSAASSGNYYVNSNIYARQYNAAGTPLHASEFQVNTFSNVTQDFEGVAMDATGDFVVIWQSNNQASSSSSYDVYARQFASTGSAIEASEFLVNTVTSSVQKFPAVTMDAAGDFLVAWQSLDQVSSYGGWDIYARQYSAAGAPVETSEYLVNTFTGIDQTEPAVAMDASGDFVLAWISYRHASASSNNDIYARRYEGPESVNLAATLGASPNSLSPGGSTTLTLGVNNNTPATTSYSNADINAALGAATGITAVFTLPTGATSGTVSGAGWSCGSQSGTSLTCNYSSSLAAANGASALTIGLTAGGASTQAVQVDVTSTQQDSDTTDNTASVTLNDVAPTATGAHLSTNAGTGITGNLSATPGFTGQVLSYAVASNPAHGGMSLNPSTGAFTYTPINGFVGSDSFTFTVSDGTLTSAPATVSIAVNDVAPQAISGTAITTAGTEVTKILVANPGYTGQALSYHIVSQPSHGSVSLTGAGGIFTYIPDAGFTGSDSFNFTVTDGTLTSNTATENIVVDAGSGSPGGGTTGGGSSGGGGGAFGLLSLALLGLPLLRRRKAKS